MPFKLDRKRLYPDGSDPTRPDRTPATPPTRRERGVTYIVDENGQALDISLPSVRRKLREAEEQRLAESAPDRTTESGDDNSDKKGSHTGTSSREGAGPRSVISTRHQGGMQNRPTENVAQAILDRQRRDGHNNPQKKPQEREERK